LYSANFWQESGFMTVKKFKILQQAWSNDEQKQRFISNISSSDVGWNYFEDGLKSL